MHLSVSTDQYFTSVWENIAICGGEACDIPNPYDYANSKTA